MKSRGQRQYEIYYACSMIGNELKIISSIGLSAEEATDGRTGSGVAVLLLPEISQIALGSEE